MNLLFRIVYAAHANGTHNKLALDGLRYLTVPQADRWVAVFLKDAERLMVGSKVPDNEFKDFQNHVLHVRDEFWGGAIDATQTWYGKVVEALKAEQWSDAVYNAGVLSHYLVDPIHPFHTAQSEAENNIHRAAEWSISKSYDALRKLGEAGPPALELSVGDDATWLRALVCRSAEIANANYERLIAHYDITRGVSDPPAGLDPIARAIVADLLIYASRCFGAVLDHAIAESGATPPEVTLTAETFLATLKIPSKWLTKKLTDAEDRRQVEAMFDELRATGRVEANLPADDKMVRDLHRTEVLAPRAAAFEKQRAAIIAKQTLPPLPVRPAQAPAPKPAVAAVPAKPVQPASTVPAVPQPAPGPKPAHEARTLSELPKDRPQQSVPVIRPAQVEANPSLLQKLASVAAPAAELAKPDKPGQVYLAMADDLEKAPSIGPKTAERFAAIGCKTVAQFLGADPAALAKSVDARHITAQDITDWQDQARLVLAVANLRGTHAQLLVGAGYRTPEAIAAAGPEKLSADILTFAASKDGQRVLRDGSPPDVARIKSWCDEARRARAA